MELHIYDFDGTLFRSPDEPSWWSKTGKGYWWTSSESLGRPCVPDHPDSSWWISSVVSQAKKSIADPDVITIMCSGRSDVGSNRYRIPELFKQIGLHFDAVYLGKNSNIKAQKAAIAANYQKKYPEINTVHMWDDTKSNRDAVRNATIKLGHFFIGHPVRVPPKEPLCTFETYMETEKDPAIKLATRWVEKKG